MGRSTREILLASRSPRRVKLLRDAGFNVRVVTPSVDDSRLRSLGRHISAETWVMSLAYLKARSARAAGRQIDDSEASIILAADTLCVQDDELVGQPCDVEDARRMIQRMRASTHRVITGVCLMNSAGKSRYLFSEDAEVRVGSVSDDEVESYLSTNEWRGKAGAYNLEERIEAGWPIECIGDPATVMGLPMRRLELLLSGANETTT